MGYFEALTSSSFKTTDDGRRLFFPWGTLGAGYLIPSVEQFERLHRHVKTYLMVSLPAAIVAVTWKGPIGGLAILPIVILPYVLWARSQCRRLEQTDVKLTMEESIAGQARAHSPLVLWLLTLVGLVFVALGLVTLMFDRERWLLAVGSIAFFGWCTAISGRMLMAQRRQAAEKQ